MKIVAIVVIVALVGGSFVADSLWRKWIAARRRQREPH